MTFAETILPEFDEEMANTRKVLERLPDDKWDWRAHPRSATIGWNANHVAEIPGWIEAVLGSDALDIHPPGGQRYQSPTLGSRQEVLKLFDRNVAAARRALAAATDADAAQTWSLLEGGKPIVTMSRAAAIRSFVLNHIIHHRAHLCVYLRLNDIPVPGMYGPSADET